MAQSPFSRTTTTSRSATTASSACAQAPPSTPTRNAPDGVTPDQDITSHFSQGTIEKSNVRAVIEMTRMIEVTRTYTQVASMLAQQSDLQKSAIEKLSDVPN